VIGGLLCATVATLVFVPAVFSLLHKKRSKTDPTVPAEMEGEPTHA
jgi:Cu/Ag efflux pump CusA